MTNLVMPKLRDVIKTRYENHELAEKDLELQAIIRRHCKNNILDWANDWLWTFDPRKKPSYFPIVLFPKQEEYLLWRIERRAANEGGVVAKTRDMGATWLNCYHQLHCWLFEEGFKGAFGSRKQDLVDTLGNPDSIFEKIRITIRYLPNWMLPANWTEGELKFINRSNGSTITGEAGDQMGRGGRNAMYDIDEAAYIEHPEKVDAAVGDNSDVIFKTSTPNGPGNPFAKAVHSGVHKVFYLRWSDHPGKTQEWYDKKKATTDPVIFAQEVDIDFTASIEGICIPGKWVRAAVNLGFTPMGALVAGYDVADGGANENVLFPRRGPVALDPEVWQGSDSFQNSYEAKARAQKLGVAHMAIDGDGPGGTTCGLFAASESPLGFTYRAIHGNGTPSPRVWEGEEGDDEKPRTSKEKFRNLRAEGWWLLRRRFEKTYQYVTLGTLHPPDEMICIPDDPILINQLSQPLYYYTENGKIQIESKKEMAKRGIKSPDRADALWMAFYEGEPEPDYSGYSESW